ncbi:unnamed protein product, partial [Rotaria socialis]
TRTRTRIGGTRTRTRTRIGGTRTRTRTRIVGTRTHTRTRKTPYLPSSVLESASKSSFSVSVIQH